MCPCSVLSSLCDDFLLSLSLSFFLSSTAGMSQILINDSLRVDFDNRPRVDFPRSNKIVNDTDNHHAGVAH